MTAMRTYLALLVAVAGCGLDDGPPEPSWATDVKPILDANCVRCHGFPATGGAPDSFRLDVYDDFIALDGRVIRGAVTMSDYIATRVDPSQTEPRNVGAMPPTEATGQGLSDRQIGILARWFLRSDTARGAPPVGNRAPTMVITWPLQDSLVDGRLVVQYEIRDPDHNLVTGELRAGPSFESGDRIGPVHSGRGEVVWDVGAVAAGNYGLHARLDDGDLHDLTIGDYDVLHVDNNHAPSLLITRPAAYDIITDIDAPYTVDLAVDDLDVGDLLSVIVEAVRGDERVRVATDEPVVVGPNSIPWDTSAVPDGAGWRLEVTVSDGTVSRTVTTLPFRISHATTSLTFADVAPVLGPRCGVCHGSGRIRNVTHDFAIYDDDADVRGVYSMRGLIYRRAVEQANMPPPTHVAQSERTEDALLTADERAMLAEWLLGGAPP